MERVYEILKLAERGTPQALARFNDGECGIMFDKNFVAARGDQKGNIELQVALIDAVKHEQENYWKGLPCPVCMKKWRDKLDEAGYINKDYENNTMAVVNTNRNWDYFRIELPIALEGKQVVWVSGDDQDLRCLDFNIVEHVKVLKRNAWSEYPLTRDDCVKLIKPHRVFIFSCGPMARVLVKELFHKYPVATYLDLGSTFDPKTRDVWHKCHLGRLKKCEGCN